MCFKYQLNVCARVCVCARVRACTIGQIMLSHCKHPPRGRQALAPSTLHSFARHRLPLATPPTRLTRVQSTREGAHPRHSCASTFRSSRTQSRSTVDATSPPAESGGPGSGPPHACAHRVRPPGPGQAPQGAVRSVPRRRRRPRAAQYRWVWCACAYWGGCWEVVE